MVVQTETAFGWVTESWKWEDEHGSSKDSKMPGKWVFRVTGISEKSHYRLLHYFDTLTPGVSWYSELDWLEIQIHSKFNSISALFHNHNSNCSPAVGILSFFVLGERETQ